jgi:hypothetical protein
MAQGRVLRVSTLDEFLDMERWDEFVRGSEQANPFSMSEWLFAVRDLLKCNVDIWTVPRGDALPASSSVRNHVHEAEQSWMRVALDWDLGSFWGALQNTVRRQGVGIGMSKSVFFVPANQLERAGLVWMMARATSEGQALCAQIEAGVRGTASKLMRALWIRRNR